MFADWGSELLVFLTGQENCSVVQTLHKKEKKKKYEPVAHDDGLSLKQV